MKFASCDGCQLTLLDLEDQLLAFAEQFEIVDFPVASSSRSPGPYDILLVEGSVSSPEHLPRIQQLREQAKVLIAIGACATAGGIQALRNFGDAVTLHAAVYRTRITSSRSQPPRPLRRMSPSTTSFATAQLTATSCSNSSRRLRPVGERNCAMRRSAWSARAAVSRASWSSRGRPASGRLRRRAAALSARASRAAATAASARANKPTYARSYANCELHTGIRLRRSRDSLQGSTLMPNRSARRTRSLRPATKLSATSPA